MNYGFQSNKNNFYKLRGLQKNLVNLDILDN